MRTIKLPLPLKILANAYWLSLLWGPPEGVMGGAVAIPIIAIVASLAAAGVAAYGQMQQGKVQKQIAERQASESQVRANYAEQAAAENARRIRHQAEYRQSERIASIGGSGVTLEGSPLKVMMDEQVQFELSALDALQQGRVEARGERAQAGIYQYSGQAAKKASQIQAGSTILSGVGSAASSPSAMYLYKGEF